MRLHVVFKEKLLMAMSVDRCFSLAEWGASLIKLFDARVLATLGQG